MRHLQQLCTPSSHAKLHKGWIVLFATSCGTSQKACNVACKTHLGTAMSSIHCASSVPQHPPSTQCSLHGQLCMLRRPACKRPDKLGLQLAGAACSSICCSPLAASACCRTQHLFWQPHSNGACKCSSLEWVCWSGCWQHMQRVLPAWSYRQFHGALHSTRVLGLQRRMQ
jgi:hypothetical protein